MSSGAITLSDLQSDLKSIAAIWETFGVHLGIPDNDLDAIKVNITNSPASKCEYCFYEVIKAWLRGPKENVTVPVLAKAVKIAGHGNLASRLLSEGKFSLDRKTVTAKLKDCKSDYTTIGVQLGVSNKEIKKFETDRGDCMLCLLATLDKYVTNNEPSVQGICQAVEMVGHKRLSDEFSMKYQGSKRLPIVPDELLLKPEIQQYTDSDVKYFPHSDAEKILTDGSNSKISFERYEQWPKVDLLKEVKMSFGAVKPKEGVKKGSVAEVYDMSKWPHGVCVIINNEKFSGHESREGTNLDECNMVQTFRHLGYIVEVHRDCEKDKIVHILDKVRERDHSQYDSFVCCIMSHGKEGHIFGSDSKKLPFESITNMFKTDECKTLANKPKLFFLQACRGKDKNKAVQVDGQGHEEGATAISAEVASDSGSEFIPNSTDFFCSYATPLNHTAYRDANHGSWFVSELCISLTSYGTFASLVDMVTKTNGEVAKNYSTSGNKQQPNYNSSLRKDVFFF